MRLFLIGQRERTLAGPLWADCLYDWREHDGGVGPALDGPPVEDTQVFEGLLAHSASTCEPCISEEDCTFCHLEGHARQKRSSAKQRKQRCGKGQAPEGLLWAECESGSVSDLFGLSARRETNGAVNFGQTVDGALSMQKKYRLGEEDCVFCPCEEQQVVLDEAEKDQAGEEVASRLQAAGGEKDGPPEAQAQEETGSRRAHGHFLLTSCCKSPRGIDELQREEEASMKEGAPASMKGLDSHVAGTCKPCLSSLRGKCRFTEDECAYCHVDGHQRMKRPPRKQW